MPSPLKDTAESLRSEENGTIAETLSKLGLRGEPKYFLSALLVMLSACKAVFILEMISRTV